MTLAWLSTLRARKRPTRHEPETVRDPVAPALDVPDVGLRSPVARSGESEAAAQLRELLERVRRMPG